MCAGDDKTRYAGESVFGAVMVCVLVMTRNVTLVNLCLGQ